MSYRPKQPTLFDVSPYRKPSTWIPKPHTLERVKSYFAGYGASGRLIYPKRQTVAEKLGLGLSTLARYLSHLSRVGWLQTVCKKAYTAVRKLLKIGPTDPAAETANKVTSQSSASSTREVLSTVGGCSQDRGPADRRLDLPNLEPKTSATRAQGGAGGYPEAETVNLRSSDVPGRAQNAAPVFVKPPEALIVNEYGRPVENPVYAAWRTVYEHARPFLERARNKQAYWRVVMRNAGLA